MGEVRVDRWVEGEGKGVYGFSSLLKQKIKGKNLLRHLHRRNFFFINYILFYVTKCLRSKKKKKKLNGAVNTTEVPRGNQART